MTILTFDNKMVAADTLTTCGDTVAYNRSKIKIIKQTAILMCGDEEDSFKFEKWYFNQANEETPALDSSSSGFIFSPTSIHAIQVGDHGTIKLWVPRTKLARGASDAVPYAEALMREVKFNAHKAAEAAAYYDRGCGPPIHSITKLQLKHIKSDFNGYWIGTHTVPISKLDQYLISYKQWLRT